MRATNCPEEAGLQVFEQSQMPVPVEQAAQDATEVRALPSPHSPLGASSAERWMNCSGSVRAARIVREMGVFMEADPEWRRDGQEAHRLAAVCLEEDRDGWEFIGRPDWPLVDAKMTQAVQVYLDYVRDRPAKVRRTEYQMHRPEIHPLFYGTLDTDLEFDPNTGPVALCDGPGLPYVAVYLEVVDYKHGAGVVVEVEDNVQVMYYANGKLAEHPEWPDGAGVLLTIVQPNAYHEGGQIRQWRTTAGALRAWLREQLVPAMQRVDAGEINYQIGEWCRFCPAKLACPAMDELVRNVLKGGVTRFDQIAPLKMLIKAMQQEEYARLMDGKSSTGGKLVMMKVDRVWKGGAEAALKLKYGEQAWTPPKLISPAATEALPGGKELVAEYAFKPEAELTVAPLTDKRAQMAPKLATGLHGAAVQRVLTPEE